jgi:hypothetical protein
LPVARVVGFDTEVVSVGGFERIGGGTVEVPKSGPYRVSAGAAWSGSDITNAYRVLQVSGAGIAGRTSGCLLSTVVPFRADDLASDTVVSGDVYLSAGDHIWVQAYHTDKGPDGNYNARSIIASQGVGIFIQVEYTGELS